MNVLEIGVDDLRSLKMWLDFFPNANIYGMDINKKDYQYERGCIFQGDQSKKKDLEKIVKKIGKCKFIIDDGSHHPEHQLLSFNYLFNKCLDYGGIYIIEDIETSYWRNAKLYDYSINSGYQNNDFNIVQIFKNIVDIVNREFLTEQNKTFVKEYNKIPYDNLKYISMITFAGNCIIIKKMTEKEYEIYGNREYRFKNKL
jgi:demethylmacrocin O-methyltransferase